jgi:ABC-type uncharacterized transport system ATPase subunit
MNDVVLEVEGITKRFPGVLANDQVNLSLRRGEILALLGENGAGKSTLMNIIYGLYHPDDGTIKLKGKPVRFASPREAIHSGIGMVHQHFQLVNVMTVAENVVLGEEATVAYQGKENSWARWMLKWLPSLVVFALALIIGLALSKPIYALGGAGVGLALGAAVAFPPAARLAWGIAWRVGLAFVMGAIAARVELVTEVGFTALALRQKVEMVDEMRPKSMEGYEVKRTQVIRERLDFDWASEARKAEDAGTGIPGVLDSAQAQLEPYRGAGGVPGWILDAIKDAPPVAHGISLALLLAWVGTYTLSSWRGIDLVRRRLRNGDLVALVLLAALYTRLTWFELDHVSSRVQLGVSALVLLVLGFIVFDTFNRRQHAADYEGKASALDEALDSFLALLNNLTEVGNPRAASERVRELSRQYGLEVDPDAVVEKLPVGMQQRVEIVKALYRKADILILDEPTAVLTPQEGRELFRIMRELAAQGVTIIFITHKLKEVFEVASHIVVMRGGRVVGTTTPDQATEASLAAMMVGREVILQVEKDEARPADMVLQVRALEAYDNRGAMSLRQVDFDVHAGEVLGIAGVQGNGQTELVEVLTGLRPLTGGTVRLLGLDLQPDCQPIARWEHRAVAFVLDTLAVTLLTYFFAYFVWYFSDETLYEASTLTQLFAVLAVFTVIDAIWFLGGWLASGGTIGMSFFSLQVVNEKDHRPARALLVQRYVIFWLLRVLFVLPALISAFAARSAPKGQTWFDNLLGLHVICRERITPRRIKNLGTSHIPEDRQRHGLVKVYSVADNLVLNDYYERPFAKAPNLAELPGALLRYLALTGGLIALFTVLALYAWDQWVWSAILDAYQVPESLRTVGQSLTGAQKGALQYPFLITVLVLLGAEVIFGSVAHLIAARVLGQRQVSALFAQIGQQMRGAIWRALGRPGTPPDPQGGLLRDPQAVDQHAGGLIQQFDIRTPSTQTDGGNLSGGNQQKMIVAREFSRKPRLLIAAQPTRGIDVGSIEFIHRQIIDQRDAGAAVLLVSAELDEIMALSDRIAVLYKGEVIDTLPAATATREQLGLLMAGIK